LEKEYFYVMPWIATPMVQDIVTMMKSIDVRQELISVDQHQDQFRETDKQRPKSAPTALAVPSC